MPGVHVETAIGQFGGVAALIRDQAPAPAAQVPGARIAEVSPPAVT
ncbi:hypothetical protein ABIA39_001410 [Nocardia sp. GAS34]